MRRSIEESFDMINPSIVVRSSLYWDADLFTSKTRQDRPSVSSYL